MNSLSFLLCLAVSLVLAKPEMKPSSGLAAIDKHSMLAALLSFAYRPNDEAVRDVAVEYLASMAVASNIFNSTLDEVVVISYYLISRVFSHETKTFIMKLN